MARAGYLDFKICIFATCIRSCLTNKKESIMEEQSKHMAYSSTDMQLFSKAKQKSTKLLHKDKVEFVDKNILVFLTGGPRPSLCNR